MPVKSVIDIDLNDAAFQRFSALFNKHVSLVKQLPGQWHAIGAATATATGAAAAGTAATQAAAQGTAAAAASTSISFNQIVAAASGAAYQIGRVAGAQNSATQSVQAQASAWHSMARSAGDFAKKIDHATLSLLRWGKITGLISGIIGGGGLFGIDRLAIAAGSARKSALGLGVTAGEEKAFDVNYGRVLDPTAFLGGVNAALHDVTKRVSFYGAGLTNKDIEGKDTAQVAQELIPALKRLADRTPDALLAQTFQARQLGNLGLSLEDFQRIKATPAGELADYGKRYQQDTKALNVGDQTLKKWQDLQVQFSRGWATLETTFIKGLVNLAEPIGHLSEAFTKAVGDLLSAPQLRQWIDDLASGVKWLADYMLTDDFHQHVLAFVKGVGDFVTAIGDAITAVEGWVNWFKHPVDNAEKAIKEGGVNGPLTDDNENAPGSPAFNRKRFGTPEGKSLFGGGTWEQNTGDREKNSTGWWDWLKQKMGDAGNNLQANAFQTIEGQNGLPPGLLNAVEYQESRGRDVTSSAGAQGYFQFEPGTAARYGVNPHDELSSAAGAAHYFRDLLAEFRGDVAKAAAAYNWGEGNVEKDIARYGERWREHLPAETSNYVNSITSHINNTQVAGGGRALVTIQNNTGGNASVSTSQLVT